MTNGLRFFPSRNSGQEYKIVLVGVYVCLLFTSLTAKLFEIVNFPKDSVPFQYVCDILTSLCFR